MPTGIGILVHATQIDSAVYTNSYSSKSEAKQTSCDSSSSTPKPHHCTTTPMPTGRLPSRASASTSGTPNSHTAGCPSGHTQTSSSRSPT
ncbi:hypothetical protein BDV12DRAFT_177368 [Aspergillus spectabilis]